MKTLKFAAKISGNKTRVIYIPASEKDRIPRTTHMVMVTVEEIQ